MPLNDSVTVRVLIDDQKTYSECKSEFIDTYLKLYLEIIMHYHGYNITKAAAAIKTDRRFLGKLVKKYLKK
jgi:hypothetical protein